MPTKQAMTRCPHCGTVYPVGTPKVKKSNGRDRRLMVGLILFEILVVGIAIAALVISCGGAK